MAIETVTPVKQPAMCKRPAGKESNLERLIREQNGRPFSLAEWSKLPAIDLEEKFPGEFERWLREVREDKGRKS